MKIHKIELKVFYMHQKICKKKKGKESSCTRKMKQRVQKKIKEMGMKYISQDKKKTCLSNISREINFEYTSKEEFR